MIKFQTFTETYTTSKAPGCRKIDEKSDTFHPSDNWNPHNMELNKQLLPFESSLTIFDMDPSLQQLFWEKILPLLQSTPPDVREKVLKNYSQEIVKRLKLYSSISTQEIYSYELVCNPANLTSTAFNHETQTYVGLHIDTHNVQGLEGREKGFQLMAINLGHSERYFYFYDLTVKEIIEKLTIKTGQNSYKDVNEIKNAFLSHFPDQPVYRLTIQPNQAYVAVSQNLIHDGGTNNHGQPDTVFLLGGYFTYEPSNSD